MKASQPAAEDDLAVWQTHAQATAVAAELVQIEERKEHALERQRNADELQPAIDAAEEKLQELLAAREKNGHTIHAQRKVVQGLEEELRRRNSRRAIPGKHYTHMEPLAEIAHATARLSRVAFGQQPPGDIKYHVHNGPYGGRHRALIWMEWPTLVYVDLDQKTLIKVGGYIDEPMSRRLRYPGQSPPVAPVAPPFTWITNANRDSCSVFTERILPTGYPMPL